MEFPSRAEAFPSGLRVLVVDDDPTWLKILEKMLKKCSYEVTTCGLAKIALDLLRERREKFDIVISDVNMPDMDGFKLLEHVGLEMDLPVIMMSVDGETSRVMKGVQHGACDYLLKPIRMKELRNIWQHVYRKKIHEIREIEGHDMSEDIQMFRHCSEDFDVSQVSNGVDFNSMRKRKDYENKEFSDQDCSDLSAVKKARVVWSVDLHKKFVNAVNQFGFDKVGPKKILDLMNVPGLTRENVASHLQKYRLYLSRLQKQNEGKSCNINMQPDFNSKAPQANLTHQNNSASIHISNAHINSPCNHNNEMKNTKALHVKDQKEVARPNTMNVSKTNTKNVTPLEVVLSFKGGVANAEYKSIEPSSSSSSSKHQPWNSNNIPVMQFMQYPKHDHEPYSLLEDYLHFPQSSQWKTPSSLITIDSVSVTTSQNFEGIGSSSWTPPLREPGLKNETDLVALPEDLHFSSLQNFGFDNVGFNSMDIFQHNDSAFQNNFLQSNWYDGLEFNCEYLYDQAEYPITDDCLFA